MKNDKIKLFRYGMFGVSIIFYLFWFFYDGPKEGVDTNGYINFSMSREPVYPLFLMAFRSVFKDEYFAWVGLFQSLLLAYATWYLCDTLYQHFKLDKFSYNVLLGINFATCLMTRFLAKRHAMYFLDIKSEGLSIPLFLLFVTELFLYTLKQQKKHLIGTMVLGTLLISVRKQMYIVILIMGLVFGLLWLIKQINFKKLLILWSLTIVTFASSVIFDMGYNLAIRGEAVRHSTDSSALLINTIYVATEADAEKIKDENVRELFLDIVTTKIENGWGYEAAPKGLRALSLHYANNFDNIAFENVNPSFYEFLGEQGVEGYVELELAFGELNDYMFASVVKGNILKILHVFVANAITGACNTVAKDSNFLIPIIVILYLMFIVAIIYLGINEKFTPEVWFGIVTLICVVVNIAVVAAMIFSQSRYMIYNMPLFYCSLYVMLRRILKFNIERSKE